MEFPRQNETGTPIYKTKQRRRRSLNVPTLGSEASEFHSTEALPEVDRSIQHPNPRKPSHVTAPATVQRAVAPRKMQAQNSKRLPPQRVEPEDYYKNDYISSNYPVAGPDNTYPIYEQDTAEEIPVRDELDETVYEDTVNEESEEAEEEQNETDVYDYEPAPPQQERHLRREYYPAREGPRSEPYVTQQTRYRKLPLSSYDMQQPNSSGVPPHRSKSPTRKQMSEPIHSIWPQNKPRKLAARSFCDAQGRLYTRSRSPEFDFNDGRRPQDKCLQRKQEATKRLEEQQQRREDGLRQVYARKQALLRHGNEEPAKPPQQYPSPRNLAEGEEYFKNLQALYQEVSGDIEQLAAVKEAELKLRKARKNSHKERSNQRTERDLYFL